MKQFEEISMETSLLNIERDMNDLIIRSNTATSGLYNTLYRSTTDLQTIKKKVAVLGDMLTDLNVISGKTKTLVDLTDLDVVSNNGIAIENGKITLAKTKEQRIEPSVKLSTILSDKPYTISEQTGRAKTIEDVFKYNTPSTLTVPSVGFDFTYILNYSKPSKINQIVIQLPSNPTSYPIIENILTLSKDGTSEIPVKILNNNSYVYSLDENRTKGNIYVIDIETIDTSTLKFSIVSKTESEFQVLSIKTNFNTYKLNGEVIFGPLVTEDPILKVGLTCEESSDNVLLQVSTDMDAWVDITDSKRISVDNVRKIIAFNTINESSFKTDEDVKRIYIKVSLVSEPLDTILTGLESYDSYREDGVVSNTLANSDLAELNRFSAFRISSDDLYYGDHTYSTGLEVGKKLRSKINTVMINGETMVLGFDQTSFSIGSTNSTYNNIDIKMNYLRLPASYDIDASEFDSVGSTLYDINLVPLDETLNVLTRNDLCYKLLSKEDTYKFIATDSKRYIELDINSNFITDSSTAILQVPNEDIKLVDSLGNLIHEFKKDSHLQLSNNLDETVYFISLLNILYEPPVIEGFVTNDLFPLKANDSNEFGLEDGKLILGKGSIVSVKGYKIIKTKINTKLEISYQNGNTWERLDTLYSYYNEQIDSKNKETNIIKLDHRSIEKGSLKIYEYNEYESIGNEDNEYFIYYQED